MSDKPPVFQDQLFIIEESAAYKLCRTGAIWMNKLFFSSLFLLAVWLLMGAAGTVEGGCTDSPNLVDTPNGTVDQGTTEHCSIWLSTTAEYLGAMTVLSFLASLAFGGLGLIVGKNVIEAARAAEEVGAGRREEE